MHYFIAALFSGFILMPSLTWSQVILERPQDGDTLSGITHYFGISCEPGIITVAFNGGEPFQIASGLDRQDSSDDCNNDGKNGFMGFTNFNLLPEGENTIEVFRDGVSIASATFTNVPWPNGTEFIPGSSPSAAQQLTLPQEPPIVVAPQQESVPVVVDGTIGGVPVINGSPNIDLGSLAAGGINQPTFNGLTGGSIAALATHFFLFNYPVPGCAALMSYSPTLQGLGMLAIGVSNTLLTQALFTSIFAQLNGGLINFIFNNQAFSINMARNWTLDSANMVYRADNNLILAGAVSYIMGSFFISPLSAFAVLDCTFGIANACALALMSPDLGRIIVFLLERTNNAVIWRNTMAAVLAVLVSSQL